MAPIVHGLEADWSDRINFVYLDIDDARTAEFKTALNYRVQPHYFLLDAQGKVVKQWLGAVQAADFVAAFNSVTQ